MAEKVRGKVPADNPHSSRGAGKRRNDGDPFNELKRHVGAFEVASFVDSASHGEVLAAFVQDLSALDRKRIRRDLRKAPQSTQERVHRILTEVFAGGGSSGPPLLSELLEDARSWLDSAPLPPEEPPRKTASEWLDLFRRAGLPEQAAAEAARELALPSGELMKVELAKIGVPQAAIETIRRNNKVSAIRDTILSEAVEAKDRKIERQLRPTVERAVESAMRFMDAASDLASLVEMVSLERRKLSRYYSLGPESIPWWFGFADELDQIAERSEKLSAELRAFAVELGRPAGGQEKSAARRAAEKLVGVGLTHGQIADLLVKTGVVGDSYSAENVRDLLRKAPARRPGAVKPGAGKTPRRPG